MSSNQPGKMGPRATSVGANSFPDELETTVPSAFNRNNASQTPTFSTTPGAPGTTAAPGGLRSILGSLTGAFGGPGTTHTSPTGMRPIKTPHESPSHPAPPTPKKNQHSLDDGK